MRTHNTRRWFAALQTAGALCIGLALAGCDFDEILDERPRDVLVADNLYSSLAGFEAGLNALYAQVRRERFGADNSTNDIYGLIYWVGTDNGWANQFDPRVLIFQEFGSRMNPQDSFLESFWEHLYETVNAANTIIERAENPDVKWTAADKARVIAEARLIRAWAYRHLTYLYGAVPMPLTESKAVKTDWERIPRDSVRKVIVSDLLFAEANLPVTSSNPGKVTKAVAQHYLAELYLALGDAASAETKAAAVINSGTHRLITQRYGVNASAPGVAFMDQFVSGNVNRSQNNTEVLWALQYALNVVGGGGSIMRRYWVNRYDRITGMQVSLEYGGRGLGRISPTRYSILLYEPQDERGGNYAIRRFYRYNNPATVPKGKVIGDTVWTVFTKESLSNNLWPSTIKWDGADPADPTGSTQWNDQPYLRLGETYLLLAEAQFKQGKLAEAATTLNTLRARAKASPITAAQVSMNFILEERSRELLCEEQRRYTLLRTGTWLDRVKLYNPLAATYAVARDTLLPIPQAVIDANSGSPMAQNPGY